MLQRIQSVWLLIASVLGFATLSNSISFFSGNKLVDNVSRFVPLTARENILILILTVTAAVAALIVIFLFKDRKMQLKLTLATLIVSIINIVLYFVQSNKYVEGKIALTSVLTFAIPVCLLLAARSIWKDEQLVKSVDRLR